MASAAVRRSPIRTIADADIAVRRLETVLGTVLGFPPVGAGWTVVTTYVTGLGSERVNHALGRTPVGYMLTTSNAPRPYPGFISADAKSLMLDFGGVAGDLTLLIW